MSPRTSDETETLVKWQVAKHRGRPCTKVGGRPCVALRAPDCYAIVSAQIELRPARQSWPRALNGGKQNRPRRLCSSSQRRVLHNKHRLTSYWSLVPLWHSQWRTASTTNQKPVPESAGLSGQVESGHPLLPSSLEKVGGGEPVDSPQILSGPPDRTNERAADSSYAH